MLTDAPQWPADPAFPGLFPELAPPAVLRALRSQLADEDAGRRASWTVCRAIEALYDPGRQVCATYVLSADETITLERAWPEGDVVYLRCPVRRPMSRRGTVIRLNGHEVEVYRFPEDRRLRGLRKFSRRESAAGIWGRWLRHDEPAITIEPNTLRRSLLRYVPEQKWIVHLRAQCYDAISNGLVRRAVAVRAAAADHCKAIYDRIVQLRRAMPDADGAFLVPKPVALDTSLGLLATRWAWGRSLLETLQENDAAQVMSRVAAGLHALHRARLPDLPVSNAKEQLCSADRALKDIVAVLPECRSRARAIWDLLSRGAGDTAEVLVTIHNDFHWNQLRIKGDRFTVLDLERCMLGEPYCDVANFATQILMLGSRPEIHVSAEQARSWRGSFLRAWEEVTGRPVDGDRMNWYSVVSLLTLARGSLRHLRPGWPAMVHRLLEHAHETARAIPGRDVMEVPA